MHPAFLGILIVIVVGIPITIVVLNLLFKNSILLRIGIYWFINIIFITSITKLNAFFPEEFPRIISLPLAICITIFFVYLGYLHVRKPLLSAVELLDQLSQGKIDVKINAKDKERVDELGSIVNSIARLSKNFRSVILNVQENAERLTVASKEISSSSEELSVSSTEQAATTEEITASLDEVISTIILNKEGTMNSQVIVKEVEGDLEVAREAVESSYNVIKQIIKKISLINEISFQTNLLAINASVEAAHAGKEGKGFGVVAREVKTLSKKSHIAAEEINELSNSSLKIGNKANELTQKVVPEIQRTSQIIRKIAAQSNEQSEAIKEVGISISQLNDITQQNAVASEELSANSEELALLAEELAKSINYFQLDPTKDLND